MTKTKKTAGYFPSGLPYNRLGRGPRPLVIFQGLSFENKPQPGMASWMYRFLGEDYTVFNVLRRPGLPQGYTLADMAADYAVMIRDEFGGPVDVIGISTGGSIVQHFAADHPDLVRRLVIHSSAHRLSDPAKAAQLEVGRLAEQRRWREAWAVLLRFMLGQSRRARLQAWAGVGDFVPQQARRSLRPGNHPPGRGSVLPSGPAGANHGANPGHRGRPRPVLHARALPRDRRRHPQRPALPLRKDGPSRRREAVSTGCSRVFTRQVI